MDELTKARQTIDEVDKQMAELFCKRLDAVKHVVNYKKQTNMAVFDAKRENTVIQKNIERLPNAEYAKYYESFINYTMELSRAMQHKILASDKIAYQGAVGAFSHIVCVKLFEHFNHIAYATWRDVFDAVNTGEADYGVLPFENSTAGDVSDVLDLCFANEDIIVTGAYDLQVTQNLLGIKGAQINDIKKVFSHPQALTQSRDFIEKIGVEKSEMANTAIAAKFVADNNDKTIGAIASIETAELYGLDVLAENVNMSKNNTTRFIVIQRKNDYNTFDIQDETISDSEKHTSLFFTVSHKSGSLAKILSIVAKHGYNMDCIKSRPMPNVNWAYYFYSELVGTPSAKLLNALSEHCNKVRVLGVYKKSN